jgi:hypothetical protein
MDIEQATLSRLLTLHLFCVSGFSVLDSSTACRRMLRVFFSSTPGAGKRRQLRMRIPHSLVVRSTMTVIAIYRCPFTCCFRNSTRCKWQTVCRFHGGVEVDPHTEHNATCRIGAPHKQPTVFPLRRPKTPLQPRGSQSVPPGTCRKGVQQCHQSSAVQRLRPHDLSVLKCDVLCTSPSFH